MNIRKYISFLRIGMIESLQFRLSLFVMFIGNLLYMIIVYYLWKAIYASSPTNIVNGMSFTDTLIYLVLATALFNFMEMYTVWEMGNSIQTGKIVLHLLKPIKYKKFLFWSYSGNFVISFVTTFLPTLIIVCIVTHGVIQFRDNLFFFLISVIMAIIINYNIDFIVGTICFFTESIWGINIMKQVVVTLLSGAVIPIAFFPEPFKSILYYLPFQSIYNATLTVLLEGADNYKKTIIILATQLFWCIIMSILSHLFWRISIRRITLNGG